MPLLAEYDALHFIFRGYPLKLTNKDLGEDNSLLAHKLTTHFQAVSTQMGYLVQPQESLVNELGYFSLSQQQLNQAESLFKLNVANYPTSANVYDSYGDYLVAKKDTANAIVQFQKALSLKEIQATRKKLTDLQAKAVPGASPADKPKE